MSIKNSLEQQSHDPAVNQMLDFARESGVKTVWDRYAAMVPQCGFGETGLCCRHCLQGPCRINPFEDGQQTGICGATADVIVARSLDRAIAAGTAAHSGHAKHLAHTLLKMAEGRAEDYRITDVEKLRSIADRLNIPTEDREDIAIAADVARAALADFHEKETPVMWAAGVVTPGRVKVLSELGLVPKGIDHEISEIMHRTLYGVDADPVNLLMGGLRCGVADLAGCYMGTDLADILFGTPTPLTTTANLGTLKEDHVNIALHGHNPVLSEIIVKVSSDMQAEAVAVGAAGINVVGICCTGNELMERHGIPSCTHSVSQEMAILTGAVDAMIVDYQCIMPSIATVAECMGTKIITTMDICKISGTDHIEVADETAGENAAQAVRSAIRNYAARKNRTCRIPRLTNNVVAGFSTESIVAALAKVDREDPLKPLAENIKNGNIRGVCLFAGCNNVKIPQDQNFTAMAAKLLENNVLLLATGCGAGSLMRHDFLDPAKTREFCGEGLFAVLNTIGEANGLGGPLPAVLHLGSCVDNSRAVQITVALANYLGVDIDQLPVVASAPEPTSEKAVSIGAYAVAAGLPTHVGVMLPVTGSALVTEVLTNTIRDFTGGYFIVDPDPESSVQKLLDAIDARRRNLGLKEASQPITA